MKTAEVKALILYDEHGKRQPAVGFVEFPAGMIGDTIEWRYVPEEEETGEES